METTSKRIVLTGGPGGGKTTLIEELVRDLAWQGRFLVLPEAIWVAGRVGIPVREQLFQRLMVETQRSLEDALSRVLEPGDPRVVLCHRGTLDPLAYWLDRGWSEEAFFAYTGTSRDEHYRRYTAVVHLVTAADGAEAHYRRWPETHRPESIAQAVHLDRLLQKVWRGHPRYVRIDNAGQDWAGKSQAARRVLAEICCLAVD